MASGLHSQVKLMSSVIRSIVSVADPSGGGGGGWGAVTPLLEFFLTKAKFTSKKLVLNGYESCLKLLEVAILETRIFKNFWGSMPPDTLLENSCSSCPPPPVCFTFSSLLHKVLLTWLSFHIHHLFLWYPSIFWTLLKHRRSQGKMYLVHLTRILH